VIFIAENHEKAIIYIGIYFNILIGVIVIWQMTNWIVTFVTICKEELFCISITNTTQTQQQHSSSMLSLLLSTTLFNAKNK